MGMTWSEFVGFESSPGEREDLGLTAANVWSLERSTICFYCCRSLSSTATESAFLWAYQSMRAQRPQKGEITYL